MHIFYIREIVFYIYAGRWCRGFWQVWGLIILTTKTMISKLLTSMGLSKLIRKNDNIGAFNKYKVEQFCLQRQKANALYLEREVRHTPTQVALHSWSKCRYYRVNYSKSTHNDEAIWALYYYIIKTILITISTLIDIYKYNL